MLLNQRKCQMPLTNKEINKIFSNSASMMNYAMPGFLPVGISRFQAFLAIQSVLTDKQYWKTLRDAYVSSDDLYHYRVDIGIAFRSNRLFKENLMNAKEKKMIDQLPEILTIYRGGSTIEGEEDEYGISWTLSKSVAEYFAFTYPRNPSTAENPKRVYESQVKKSEILALFLGRKEDEVIYLAD